MKSTMMLGLAMLLTLAIQAQPPGKPMHGRGPKQGMEQRNGDMQKRMISALNLTEAQQNQFKALNAEFRLKMKALRENENITVKQQRDQMFNLAKQHRAEMKKMLTTEQQTKMEALRAEQQGKMKEMHHQNFERMATNLNLTEAQKQEIEKLQQKHMAEMKALRENDNLDRTTLEKKVKSGMEQHQKEMGKILSKEQMEKWESLKKENPAMRKGSSHRKGGGGRGFSPQPVI